VAKKENNNISQEQNEFLKSINSTKIFIPILLGLIVVAYLLWKQYDPEEFAKIEWTSHTLIWIFAAMAFLVFRHLAYAMRLRILSGKKFSWKKAIELIFIWEFSSAVSPTSIGGSAVALFVLSNEKLSTAKTATIVLYTVVQDSFFFLLSLPVFIYLLGNGVIHPTLTGLEEFNAWRVSFWTFYTAMAIYAMVFFYGLFLHPENLKRILIGSTKIPFLKRFRKKAINLGNDMIISSEEMRNQNWKFHFGSFMGTAGAWIGRFLLLNCLIIAFVPETSLEFLNQLMLYARQKAMFMLIAFSPTPGGAGIIEMVFGDFLIDFISIGTASVIIAFLWRLMTYYAYLIAGVIVIPNWINKIFINRNIEKPQE